MGKQPSNFQNPGYLYVIEEENGLVKIGRSVNPKRRMPCVASGIPQKTLRTHISQKHNGHYYAESTVKEMFSSRKIKGEWFALSFEDAVIAVDKVVSDLGKFVENKESKQESDRKFEQFFRESRKKVDDNDWACFIKDQNKAAEELTKELASKGYDQTVYFCEVTNKLRVKSLDGGDVSAELFISSIKELVLNKQGGPA